MSTAERRRGKSLHLELPGTGEEQRPSIVALFLVQFDVKAGYTIAWKRSISGLELAESVEFKSLPSGLHNVEEDLIYFMHDDLYAGISAFVNRSAAHWDRNALMLAVGALVPLENGRLGRNWRHAEKLKEIAEHLVLDPTRTQPLEDFWEEYQLSEEALSATSDSRPSSAKPVESERSQSLTSAGGKRPQRNRAISSASGLGQGLSPHHPALSLPTLLNTFGPLVYPLYKASLLRKRILLVTQAPVELACNFVYDMSILSTIPSSVSDLLPLEPLPNRLRPLFSVGVHDIDALSKRQRISMLPKDELVSEDPGYGWVACTTDDVLGSKSSLYDVLVSIPPSYSKRAEEKVWPIVRTSQGAILKASQRDRRRYQTLRQELRRSDVRSRSTSPYSLRKQSSNDSEDDQATLLPIENTQETFDDTSSTSDEKLIEPLSWSALAYSTFMWWASAGEKRADLDEENEHDAALFREFNEYSTTGSAGPRSQSRRRDSGSPNPWMGMMTDGTSGALELAIIAYFHRLSALILGTLAQLVDASDAQREGEESSGDEILCVGSEDISRMGLDVWSEGDRKFVEELLEFYWGRRAEVQGGRVDCCGIRIC